MPLWGMLCGHPVDGNSGKNPKQLNMKRVRKRDSINTQRYFTLRFICNACPERSRRAKPPKPRSKRVAIPKDVCNSGRLAHYTQAILVQTQQNL